jgi:hypothetical protein
MTALGVADAREMGSIVRFGQIYARSSKDRKWPASARLNDGYTEPLEREVTTHSGRSDSSKAVVRGEEGEQRKPLRK